MADHVEVRRLGLGDEVVAAQTFELMAAVFDEPHEELSDGYVTALLDRVDFWVMVALLDERPVGGLTAHSLSMTRSESTELFIYDLAVSVEHQRRGIGRELVEITRRLAAAAGIDVAFVPADDDDEHAIDFYRAIGGAASPVTFFEFGGLG